MLDEWLEFHEYTYDLNSDEKHLRLKHNTLITKNLSGLMRAMTIIARYYVFDARMEKAVDPQEEVRKILKLWLGHSDGEEGNRLFAETADLRDWLPRYIQINFLKKAVALAEKTCREQMHSAEKREQAERLLGRIATETDPRKRQEAMRILYGESGGEEAPQGIRQLNNVVKCLCALSNKEGFFTGSVYFSGDPEENNLHEITCERVYANANRSRPLGRYYLACGHRVIDRVEKRDQTGLKPKEKDMLLKLTACYLLEATKYGERQMRMAKAVRITYANLTNWLIYKKWSTDSLKNYMYGGQQIAVQTTLLGETVVRNMKKNVAKARLSQPWLDDGEWMILKETAERDVITDFLNQYPDGCVYKDAGSGVPLIPVTKS